MKPTGHIKSDGEKAIPPKEPEFKQIPINTRVLKRILARIDQLGPNRIGEHGKVDQIYFINRIRGLSYRAFAKWDGDQWLIWVTNECKL